MTNTAPIEAVAELIRRQKLRIDITPAIGYWVKAPCLLTQLETAKTGGMETGGRGIPASRSPLAVDAFDLWYKIWYNTHGLAHHLGLNRTDPQPESPTPWLGRLLRHCAAEAISRALPHTADRIEHNARSWAAQITTMLTGFTEQRGLRGAQCRHCTATTVLEQRPDGIYRIPAVLLVSRDTLRWLVCQACGETEAIVQTDQLVHLVTATFDDAGRAVV